MTNYQFSAKDDAQAMCVHLASKYPAYTFQPVKPKGCRLWLIACHCRVTDAFLQYAKR